MKYRGVDIGEVTRISFSYVKYELDKPMTNGQAVRAGRSAARAAAGRRPRGQRHREPRIEPARSGEGAARAARAQAWHELSGGLRRSCAEPGAAIDWVPDNIYASAPSTLSSFVNAASDIVERLRKLDVEGTLANLNKLLATTNDRIASLDTQQLQERTTRARDRPSTISPPSGCPRKRWDC